MSSIHNFIEKQLYVLVNNTNQKIGSRLNITTTQLTIKKQQQWCLLIW